MKNFYSVCTCFFLSLFSSYLFADEALIAREEVQFFIEKLTHSHPQLDRATVYDTLLAAEYKPDIIVALDRPSTSLPWYRFEANMISDPRINQGVLFLQNNRTILDQVYQKYGVPPEIIVAILGIETNYGKEQGKFRTIDALSTIAFYYPRRATYFQQELEAFFILAHKLKKDPLEFKSSYAGAMGMPQFMPSSLLNYAIDMTGDKEYDLWDSSQDVIASVANYLYQFGWKKDGKMVSPTLISCLCRPELMTNYMRQPFSSNKTMTEWEKEGVLSLNSTHPTEKAILFALEEEDQKKYWLGFNNFYVITRYNQSTNYAMAVIKLAEKIKQSMVPPLLSSTLSHHPPAAGLNRHLGFKNKGLPRSLRALAIAM